MGALLVLLLTAVGPPNLCADIVNGDFSAGNTGFTSEYKYVSPADAQPAGGYPLGMWAEGTYSVDTDPHNQHDLWASFGDHTDHTGGQDPLRANIDETVHLVVITEQGENRDQLEDQWNLFGFPHGFARRAT